MSDATPIRVEVAYALPEEHKLLALEVTAGTTAMEAAQQSAIADHFPDLTLDDSTRLGIFGQAVPLTQVLNDGDRVEIYRPLLADPKEVRKARAAKAKERRNSGTDNPGDGEADGALADS